MFNYCKMVAIGNVFVTFPLIVIMVLIYRWLHLLDTSNTCECSQDFRRKYLRWFMLVWIVVTVCMLAYFWYQAWFVYNCQPFQKPMLYSWIQATMIWFVGTYVIAALQYLKILKERKCECALQGMGDDLLRFHAYLYIALFAITILAIIMIIGLLVWAFPKSR